jgi:hypothetical protein
VYFLDTQRGHAVGTRGLILQTTNGGQTWRPILTSLSEALFSVQMVDSLVGFASGSRGRIVRTTNGGNTWFQMSSGTIRALTAVQFVDQDTGWATTGAGLILKSTNSGVTWGAIPSGYNLAFLGMHFLSPQEGWVVGRTGIIMHYTTAALRGELPEGRTPETTPSKTSVVENFPNPFNPATRIRFTIADPARITLKIYDVLGREVATLIDGEWRSAGAHEVEFAGNNLAGGIYFARVTGEGLAQPVTRKMLLVK